MRTVFHLVRALVYATGFILAWGWLATQVRQWDHPLGIGLPGWTRALGLALLILGGGLALTCVVGFALWGAGTPAPFDAPRQFVVRGPYRFVRNPMYLGGAGMLVGFGLQQRSAAILVLAIVMLLCAHLFVLLYEEPTLEHRFGDDYRAYKREVRRWLPRLGRPQ